MKKKFIYFIITGCIIAWEISDTSKVLFYGQDIEGGGKLYAA